MPLSRRSLTTLLSHWRWGYKLIDLWLVLGSALFNWWCVFQGVLPGAGEDVPTIVITAHYDSFGLAPVSDIKLNSSSRCIHDCFQSCAILNCVCLHLCVTQWLSYGADSNGSGVTILLELARLFQKLYSSPRTRPPWVIVPILTWQSNVLTYMNCLTILRFLRVVLDIIWCSP